MDRDLRQSMFRYYDERAPEYEEGYVLGTGTASIPDPNVFRTEAALLAGIVERFGEGRLADIACGTGYWLRYYAGRCSRVMLLDQSQRMLDECGKKVAALGIADRCSLVRADVLDHPFEHGSYDCALIGFLFSHLTGEQEDIVFRGLQRMLRPSGRFLILDSAWSTERARFNSRIERQQRQLNDGTPFEIYKRYIGQEDLSGWAARYGATISVDHFGAAFCAVSGRFTHGIPESNA